MTGVKVKAISPVNQSESRRATYEVITFEYDEIRWHRLEENVTADVASFDL